ncbi:transcriptional regulator, partial [Klebsiella pneumoniae]|uniref:cupin domain-containing protein n=1 Tax=Klebsiella pneumoniae TaxID=573 RepID=UPI000BCBBE09
RHSGEETGTLLEGEITLVINGEHYHLSAGESYDNGRAQRTLGMLLETYQPGASTGEKLRHSGEETGTLLEGEITLVINGEHYHLSAGESY